VNSRCWGWLFLSGVLLQVLLAWIYKTAMWQLYMAETNATRATGRWYRSALWISEAMWLEVLVDLITIVLFAVATVVAFLALTNVSPHLRARAALDFGYLPALHR